MFKLHAQLESEMILQDQQLSVLRTTVGEHLEKLEATTAREVQLISDGEQSESLQLMGPTVRRRFASPLPFVEESSQSAPSVDLSLSAGEKERMKRARAPASPSPVPSSPVSPANEYAVDTLSFLAPAVSKASSPSASSPRPSVSPRKLTVPPPKRTRLLPPSAAPATVPNLPVIPFDPLMPPLPVLSSPRVPKFRTVRVSELSTAQKLRLPLSASVAASSTAAPAVAIPEGAGTIPARPAPRPLTDDPTKRPHGVSYQEWLDTDEVVRSKWFKNQRTKRNRTRKRAAERAAASAAKDDK